jgi:hypothetical protein
MLLSVIFAFAADVLNDTLACCVSNVPAFSKCGHRICMPFALRRFFTCAVNSPDQTELTTSSALSLSTPSIIISNLNLEGFFLESVIGCERACVANSPIITFDTSTPTSVATAISSSVSILDVKLDAVACGINPSTCTITPLSSVSFWCSICCTTCANCCNREADALIACSESLLRRRTRVGTSAGSATRQQDNMSQDPTIIVLTRFGVRKMIQFTARLYRSQR